MQATTCLRTCYFYVCHREVVTGTTFVAAGKFMLGSFIKLIFMPAVYTSYLKVGFCFVFCLIGVC